jgi:hypothetical protein
MGPAGSGGLPGAQGPAGLIGATGPMGPQGLPGANGVNGLPGTNGQGVPAGGTVGQILTKIDGTNFKTQWITLSRIPSEGSNTKIGTNALYSNTTGASNSSNGYQALYKNTIGNNNTANGYQALYSNTSGTANTANGIQALIANTTGVANSADGRSALATNTVGSYNTAVGFWADVTLNNLTNATAIGYNAKVNASNKVRIGNTSVTAIEGQVPWTATSDKRLKNHIADLPLGLDFITKLRPVEYVRNNNAAKTKEWGVIAQELQQTLHDVGYKEAGVVSEDASPEKYMAVRYNDLMAPMIKAIQEQQKTIAALQKRIEVLEKK